VWAVGYTSTDTVTQGVGPFVNENLRTFLGRGLEDDVAGVILNPTNRPFPMTEELLHQLIRTNAIHYEMGDITTYDVDAIVNAANSSLLGGGGVDGAIHRAAGPGLLAECRTLGGCPTGEAKITKGYNLKARYVIHTVGPVYSGLPEDKQLLASCYANSLDVALAHDVHTICFPAISTGVYGYPKQAAAAVAVTSVAGWLHGHPEAGMDVTLVAFDRGTYDEYRKIFNLAEDKQ